MNVFSSFNPSNFLFNSSMLINFFLCFILMLSILLKISKFNKTYIFVLLNMFYDFLKLNKSKISITFIIIILLFNMFINVLNLLPFSFCQNSQIYYFFSLSFLIWISCLIFSLKNNFKATLLHLVPFGCPIYMSFFMFIIELVSNLIRPITLSVRMSANLLAGHLLMHLITEFSFFLVNISISFIPLAVLILFLLNILELGVSLIQPYIFCTLINMYISEN